MKVSVLSPRVLRIVGLLCCICGSWRRGRVGLTLVLRVAGGCTMFKPGLAFVKILIEESCVLTRQDLERYVSCGILHQKERYSTYQS